MSVSFLQRASGPDLAHQIQKGENFGLPTIVFFTGLRSDMEGTKAVFLAKACGQAGQTYVRFDYRGHGASGGRFVDGTIGLWLEDALSVIDELTTGPLVLVGSSMGGWVALLAAMARKKRVRGLIGLAAAPDFTRDIRKGMSDETRAALEQNGAFFLPSDYEQDPHTITKAMLDDGEAHCLLDKPIPLTCKLRLMQGMKDSDVPWQTAHRIANVWAGDDKQVYLRENGDHRLSTQEDLTLLEKLRAELSAM